MIESIHDILVYVVLHRICLSTECSKISSTFHFLFSKKMWVIRAGIHKILLRIANREDLDQTDLVLRCLSMPIWLATSVRNFRTLTVVLVCDPS